MKTLFNASFPKRVKSFIGKFRIAIASSWSHQPIPAQRLQRLHRMLASMNIALVATHGCRTLSSTSPSLLRTLARPRASLSAASSRDYFAPRRSLGSKSSAFPCKSSITDVTVKTATNSAENGCR